MNRSGNDFRHAASLNVCIIDCHAEVFDAVHTVIHRLQDIDVIGLIELIGVFRIRHRIKIDRRQMRPQRVRHTVYGITANGSRDALCLRHRGSFFPLHRKAPF